MLISLLLANSFHLEHSRDEFGLRSHGVVETTSGGPKFYPLPQSTSDQYRLLRAEDTRINPLNPAQYRRQEVIGPNQTEGEKIWFGNNFYHGEGLRGVGAFGYFDTAARTYTLFSPREIARYEISAILVEADAVWLALDQFGEDISKTPGGLARWDRATRRTERYPLEFNIDTITREGDSLRLTTHDGYAFFRNGEVHRFLGRGRPIGKFPPPPTKN